MKWYVIRGSAQTLEIVELDDIEEMETKGWLYFPCDCKDKTYCSGLNKFHRV